MRDTLKKLRDSLRPLYGNRESEAIIRLIFHYVKRWNTVDMIIHEGDTLSDFTKSEIDGILHRLLRHEPIQYITGEARFHGMDLHVSPDVLIPRPETDELVDIISDNAGESADLRVLDVGTGSGCIAIALARSLRFPKVTAIDISEPALKIAQGNAKRLKTDINFIHADIFSLTPEKDSFDIIVSNPPYIDDSEKPGMEANVTGYEPHMALFVPDDNPIIFYRRIIDIGNHALRSEGRIYFEINPRHADEIVVVLKTNQYRDITILKDSYGKNRFISAMK